MFSLYRAATALLIALGLSLSAAPAANAAWAVAFVEGGKPIVVGGGNRTAAASKQMALSTCNREFGGGCKIMLSGNNNCASIANNYPNSKIRWAFGTDRTKALAGKKALASCKAQGIRSCVIAHDFCGP